MVSTLLSFAFIKRVYIAENYIALTKNDYIEWFEVQEEVRVLIQDYLRDNEHAFNESQLPIIENGTPKEKIVFEPSAYDAQIIDLLEEYVQPAVSRDGGAIHFAGFKDGTVFVQMYGACLGCPSSTQTLKEGVERLLKNSLPQVQEVRAI